MLNELAVKNLKEKDLRELLATGSPVSQCEKLLKTSMRLPESWHAFVTDKVMPAVMATLFGTNGVLKKEQLLDTKNWPRIAAIRKQSPHVYVLMEDRLQSLFLKEPYTQLAQTVRRMRSEEAWPIIILFITTIKKRNKKMANDMEKLFKELKGAKNKRKRSRMNIALLVGGFLCGILLTAGILMAYNSLFGEKPMALNQHFYGSPSTLMTDNAKAVVFAVDEKDGNAETMKLDTIAVTKDKSLLSSLYNKPCRVDRIIVADTVSINIPNKEWFAADSTGVTMQDTKYYFRVVKYVNERLPQGIQIAY